MKQAVLKRPPQGSLRYGHPWIYRNQIKELSTDCEPGEILQVVTESGKFLGRAYWNPKSEISLRVLSRRDETVDLEFLKARIAKAAAFRERAVTDTNAFRLISSEADELPGLIVDKYGEILVMQLLTLGMERMKDDILAALNAVVPNRGIYERSDSNARRLEGLPERVGWVEKNCGDEITILERDVEILMRFGEGHKTGWYLDQRENRLLLRDLARPGDALDVFCYEGGFGLQLAKAGMRVLGIESQKDAIERGLAHRNRNRIPDSQLSFLNTNAFEALKDFERSGTKYDLIVLDPPSFGRQKATLGSALAGYKELMLRGFRLLNEGGRLAVFSCAYHIDDHFLMQACLAAAQDARRSLRVLRFMKQASDHPVCPFIPETYYLKGFLFEVTAA